jgi:hypothetical protein
MWPRKARWRWRASMAMRTSQIAALKVLADIHTRHALPGPELMMAPNAVLHYLHLALEIAATIEGYTVPGDRCSMRSRASMPPSAIISAPTTIALQASAARDKTHSQQATNRAIAMQVQYQTERAQTEGEHHRQLAAAEAQRAEVLQQTSATLEHLSAIGQEITAHLDGGGVPRARPPRARPARRDAFFDLPAGAGRRGAGMRLWRRGGQAAAGGAHSALRSQCQFGALRARAARDPDRAR